MVQYFYDSHYDGAEQAAGFVEEWKKALGHIDEAHYTDILNRFEYQAKEAVVWRDTICEWAFTLSGIPDQNGRVAKSAANGST